MQKLVLILLLFLGFETMGQSKLDCFDCSRRGGARINGANFFQSDKMSNYDIRHLKVDITVQPKSKFITSICSYTVSSVQSLDTFAIELKQTMSVDSVF